MKNFLSSVLKRKVLVFIMFFLPCMVFSQKVKQMVSGKIVLEDDKVAGTVISISKDGVLFKKISINETGRFLFSLDYHQDYILSFEKNKYVTKKIFISTKVPKNTLDEGYDPIEFTIALFKQYEGLNTVIFNQPVGRWTYDDKNDGFVYDMDYTKSIQSEIAKVEADVKVKQEEEKVQKEQQKQQEITENKNKQNANANTKKNPNPEDDAGKKAKGEGDEEWKKKLNPKKYNDFKDETEEEKQKKKQMEKDKLKAKADEDNKKKLEAKAKEEELARLYKEAKAKGDEELRKLLADSRMKSYLSGLYPVGITIEITKDPKKEVKRIIVNRNGMCNIYSEVKHSWGGKYCFKNSETISQVVFNKETKPLANEPVINKSE